MGDEVAGLHTCFGGRGVINGCDDFNKAIFLGHFNAKATKGAAGLNAHVTGIIRRQIA